MLQNSSLIALDESEMLNRKRHFCVAPGTALPSSTAAAAGDEEDRDEGHRSYQEDGEDHQEEHIAILLLRGLEWDLLKIHRVRVQLQVQTTLCIP